MPLVYAVRTAVFVALSSALTVAHATTGPLIGQGSATLSNLSFQVVDLNPKDLVAPGFAVRTANAQDVLLLSGDFNSLSADKRVTGTVFSNSTDSVTVGNGFGSASKLGNSMSASFAVDAQTLTNFSNIPSSKYDTYLGNKITSSATNVDDGYGPDNIWILKAGTQVTISGTLQVGVAINGDSFTSLSYLTQNPGQMIDMQGTSNASVTVYAVPSDPLQAPDYQTASLQLTGEQLVSSSGVQTVGSVGTTLTKNFSLSVSNTTNQNMLVSLTMGVSTLGQWKVAALTAVPEPMTSALFGLGLVGLTMVTRRRHAAR